MYINKSTVWGDLDYLIIDMPPGTGDIHITLGQEVKFDAALIVTTPQDLSYVDVIKGIEMFDDLKVPTLSIIENMSYHLCAKCDHKNEIFGTGKIEQIKKQFGIKNSFDLPLIPEVAQSSDRGCPPIFAFPSEHIYRKTFEKIVRNFDTELEILKMKKPEISFNYETGKQSIQIVKNGVSKSLKARHVRLKCQCALCIDELSGRKVLNDQKVPSDVHPTQMIQKGNYAVAIIWSDGHKSSIYPFDTLLDTNF